MGSNYNDQRLQGEFGRARPAQFGQIHALEQLFSVKTLKYLDEKIINHLMDQLAIRGHFGSFAQRFNDFSFLIAPGYKALEGYLFQLAKDLKLPSAGNTALVGSYYFDEEMIDEQIDLLITEIEGHAENSPNLSQYEKSDIKSRIKEMKDFLKHYRHSPAHFTGEPIDTLEKAERTVMVIFAAIDNTTLILLKAKLIT